MEEEPLVNFSALRDKLIALGFHIKELKGIGGYTEVESQDVTLGDIQNGTLKIDKTGIFNIDPDTGEVQRIFLYKRKYNLERFGKPRYHICKCQTIEDFMNAAGAIPEYRKANKMPVCVIDTSDNNKDKQIDNLPLCKNCAAILGNINKNTTSNEFVEILKKAYERFSKESQSFLSHISLMRLWQLPTGVRFFVRVNILEQLISRTQLRKSFPIWLSRASLRSFCHW